LINSFIGNIEELLPRWNLERKSKKYEYESLVVVGLL
jgi:hypothetical protein